MQTFNRKKIPSLVAVAILLLMTFFLPPYFGMTLVQQRTLLLLVISILLWTTNLFQTGISSLLVIGLAIVLDIADDFSTAIQGFLSSTIYFILVVALISSTMIKVGLDQHIAASIVRLSKGNIRRVALSFFTATLLLPIVIPSGNARVQMFIPLVEQIGKKYAPEIRIPFQRFTVWTLGGINQLSTTIVLSGGGLAVLASQLVAELNLQLNWLNWFLFMAPPIWLTCILTGTTMWYFWKISDKAMETMENPYIAATRTDIEASSSRKIWLVVVSLIALIVSWIVAPEFGVPLIVPPMLLLGFLALPGIDLLSNRDLRNYDWENFLLLGTALSLAFIIEQNGTADWIISIILTRMGQGLPTELYLLILVAVVICIRMFFTSPVAALTVMYPLVKSFAEWVGLNPIHSLLLTIMVVTGMLILPIHSPIMYLAFKSSHITIGEHLFISIIQLLFTILVGMVAFWFYWPLVTELAL